MLEVGEGRAGVIPNPIVSGSRRTSIEAASSAALRKAAKNFPPASRRRAHVGRVVGRRDDDAIRNAVAVDVDDMPIAIVEIAELVSWSARRRVAIDVDRALTAIIDDVAVP